MNDMKPKIKEYLDFFMEVCEENGIEKEKCEELKVELIKDIIVAMATQKMNSEALTNMFKGMFQPQIPQGGDIYG